MRKSLQYIFPLEYPLELVERSLVRVGSPEHLPVTHEGGTDVQIVPEDFAKLPEAVPPPRVWLDSHGDTPDCSGCASRKGRRTNKCVARYHGCLIRPDEGRMEPWPWQMMVCSICLWMSIRRAMSRKRMKRRRSQRRERHRRMWRMMRRRPLRREHRWCQVRRPGCRERPGARLVTRG